MVFTQRHGGLAKIADKRGTDWRRGRLEAAEKSIKGDSQAGLHSSLHPGAAQADGAGGSECGGKRPGRSVRALSGFELQPARDSELAILEDARLGPGVVAQGGIDL